MEVWLRISFTLPPIYSSDSTRRGPWPDELDGGILLQEPYQTEAYCDETEKVISAEPQQRFLNLTYKPANGKKLCRRPLVRGVSLGSLTPNKEDFDTQKVAHLDTLKRCHKLRKTESAFPLVMSPEKQQELLPLAMMEEEKLPDDSDVMLPEEEVKLLQKQEKEDECGKFSLRDLILELCTQQKHCFFCFSGSVLDTITATFDERMRLLLDPHYTSPEKTPTPPKVSLSAAKESTVEEAKETKEPLEEVETLSINSALSREKVTRRASEKFKLQRQEWEDKARLNGVLDNDSIKILEKVRCLTVESTAFP